MNDAKSTITLLACCCIILKIAPSASADYVGVTSVFPDDPDTVFECTEGNGWFVPGPLTVCDVFAVFDDPDDTLLGVGNADLQVFNGTIPYLFYQHPVAGSTPRTYRCSSSWRRSCAVGASDLAQLLGNWGLCPGCPADFNGDDVVDPFDLAVLLGAWGSCP